MNTFVFGTFEYAYTLLKEKRKTLSLTVTPDLCIIVKCPINADNERIESFLRKKWFWLEKQLSFFKKYQRKIYAKEYVSGEGYLYLGRQYKLVIKKGSSDSLKLTYGQLMLVNSKSVSDTQHSKKILDKWFASKSEQVFNERLSLMLKRFDYDFVPGISIRDMRRRWGSFLISNKILLNPKLIHMPKYCIDYVIVHELCHLKYKNHGAKFWSLLNKKFPKWEKVKDRLEIFGASIK